MTTSRAPWVLDPTVTFLNHGSFGACPEPVLARQAELRARLEAEPVRFFVRELEPLLDAARDALARHVGADPEDLVFVPNATAGVNTVLRSLQLAPGDELLVGNQGYNACRNAAAFVADRSGARLREVHLPFPVAREEDLLTPWLEALGPRTRLVLVDHVTSPTGLLMPVERVVAACAERGVDVLVDGAHGPGMLPLDLTALGAAWYTGNAHKWLCAPKGAGFLHVRRDRRDVTRPLSISHGANSPRHDRSRLRLEFDWTGTADPTPALCLPVALELLGSLVPGGWPGLRAANRSLALAARQCLCRALGIAAPAPETLLGSLASVPLPDAPVPPAPAPPGIEPLQERLWQEHRIEVPVMTWPAAPRRLLRVSAQAYNRLEEYEALARVLPGLLAEEGTPGRDGGSSC